MYAREKVRDKRGGGWGGVPRASKRGEQTENLTPTFFFSTFTKKNWSLRKNWTEKKRRQATQQKRMGAGRGSALAYCLGAGGGRRATQRAQRNTQKKKVSAKKKKKNDENAYCSLTGWLRFGPQRQKEYSRPLLKNVPAYLPASGLHFGLDAGGSQQARLGAGGRGTVYAANGGGKPGHVCT